MNKIAVVMGFLIVATALESSGDAVVRMGLANGAQGVKALQFLAGAILLFGYGIMLNLAPLPFGRVVGLYVATVFVAFQIVNFVAFKSLPTLPVLIGGALIVAGGAIVSLWPAAEG